MNATLKTLLATLLLLPANAFASPTAGLDKLKQLTGTWEGKSPDGKAMKLTFKPISEGTAILESHEGDGHKDSMVTIYQLDGDGLMLTHYCSMGNQPRMRATKVSADSKEIVFDYVDASNLAKPDAPHMHKLVFRFDDTDHITQEWTLKNGKDEKTMPLKFTRAKA